jgi:hypothetical protein
VPCDAGEVGPPVAGQCRRFPLHVVDHQVEQLVAARHVPVERGRAGAEVGDDDWLAEARAVSERLPLAAHRVDVEIPGLADGGALLVRPDQFVAWRAPAGSSGDLEKMLRQLLDR